MGFKFKQKLTRQSENRKNDSVENVKVTRAFDFKVEPMKLLI